jgi:hypothetical protein
MAPSSLNAVFGPCVKDARELCVPNRLSGVPKANPRMHSSLTYRLKVSNRDERFFEN